MSQWYDWLYELHQVTGYLAANWSKKEFHSDVDRIVAKLRKVANEMEAASGNKTDPRQPPGQGH